VAVISKDAGAVAVSPAHTDRLLRNLIVVMSFHGHRPTGAASLPRHNGIRGVRPSNLTAAFCSAEVQHAYRSFLQGDVEADHFARHTLEKVWARETAGNVHAVKRRCVSERGIPARAPSRHTHGWRAAKVAIYRGAHCPHMARKLRLSRHKPSARPPGDQQTVIFRQTPGDRAA
jgi:hypothetical protein